jgi:hypothetical protein
MKKGFFITIGLGLLGTLIVAYCFGRLTSSQYSGKADCTSEQGCVLNLYVGGPAHPQRARARILPIRPIELVVDLDYGETFGQGVFERHEYRYITDTAGNKRDIHDVRFVKIHYGDLDLTVPVKQ